MTDIEAAARATRRYIVDTDSDGTFYISGPKGDIPGSFDEYPEAQAACDRMNLQAVLEAISGPSDAIIALLKEDAVTKT